jgi:hypothetical protein
VKITLLIVTSLLLLQGCATTIQLAPVAREDQKTVYRQGLQTLLSSQESIVAVRPESGTYESSSRITFLVSVFNGTDEPLVFSIENIEAYVGDSGHRVFTYEELAAEVRRRQAWAAVGAALSGLGDSMSASSAGHTYHYGTTSSYAYGSQGTSAFGHGTYSGYSYNSAAAQQAQAAADARTQENMRRIADQTERSLEQLGSTVLMKETVMPGYWHGGRVTIEKVPDSAVPSQVKLVVWVGREQHEFVFKYSELDS